MACVSLNEERESADLTHQLPPSTNGEALWRGASGGSIIHLYYRPHEGPAASGGLNFITLE